jgi:monooxygenase
VPDADLFKAIGSGRASVVTDHIATFTETGIELASGQHLDADIIVTATGLNVQLFGGMAVTVDGQPVDLARAVAYKGIMLSGVPNFAFAFGYTNSSWTLKVGLLCEHFCRLLSHMDAKGFDRVRPQVSDPDMETLPLLDFAAGYVQRVAHTLPRQGVDGPWVMSMNYNFDRAMLRNGAVTDPNLWFGAAERTQVPEYSATL